MRKLVHRLVCSTLASHRTIMQRFYFLFILLAACTSHPEKKLEVVLSTINDPNQRLVESKTKVNDLVGTWGIYSEQSGSQQILCNQCPSITFYSNQAAMIKYPSFWSEHLQWKREGEFIELKNLTVNNGAAYLADGKYSLDYSEDIKHVQLIRSSDNYTYGLSKHDVDSSLFTKVAAEGSFKIK
jgi:hypothetical protein